MLRKLNRLFLVFIFTCICGLAAKATHIVGGDLTYKYLGNDSFEITLILYVDCINGNPGAISADATAMLGVFDSAGTTLIKTLSEGRSLPVRINSVNYNCVLPPSNACVDKYTYTYLTHLPFRAGGYTIDFQRCCRNNTITNIINSGNTGATYFIHIPDHVWANGHNTSAVFKTLPPNFLCVDRDFIYDHSAADADGDSLAYELYVPFEGADPVNNRPQPPSGPPFANVIWSSGFSTNAMMQGIPDLQIQTQTGLLSVKPKLTGQFVVGIAVKEFRNGKHINTTRRDFQFNVLNCVIGIVSAYTKDIKVCSDTVRFVNSSFGASTYFWDFGIDSADTDTSTLFEPVFVYPKTGTYKVKLVSADGTCKDSATSAVTIDRDIGRFAGNDTTVCIGTTFHLGNGDSAGFTYKWSPALYLDNDSVFNPLCRPKTKIVYNVLRKSEVCTNYDTLIVDVKELKANFHFLLQNLCTHAVLSLDSLPPSANITWELNGKPFAGDLFTAKKWEYDSSYTLKQMVNDSVCYDTLEKEIKPVYIDSLEWIPNVFSPNDDGLNDCYSIKYVELGPECDHLFIFNRWGGLVFDSDKHGSCWNGKINDAEATPGVYFYILRHRKKEFHGTISLVR